MNNKISLSVIIPVYNEEKTVLKLLNNLSVIVNYCKTEIIVINDGSTDSTKKILSENNTNTRILLEFDQKYHNYFDELILIENQKFDLNKYVILENYQNCFLIQDL